MKTELRRRAASATGTAAVPAATVAVAGVVAAREAEVPSACSGDVVGEWPDRGYGLFRGRLGVTLVPPATPTFTG